MAEMERNDIIEVTVLERVKIENEMYYKVSHDQVECFTRCFGWQLLENYTTPKTLLCFKESINIEPGILFQMGGKHLQHPNYRLGEEYCLKVIAIEKINNSPNEIKLILRGPDNLNYNITYYASRFESFEVNQDIICKYTGISTNGNLAFFPKRNFFSIEDILIDTKAIKITFYDLTNYENPLSEKLFDEYHAKENIWIFTYCKLISEKIFELMNNLAHEETLIFIDSLIHIENWVINSGFLTSFNLDNRKNSKVKAERTIETFSVIREYVSLMQEMKYQAFIENLLRLNERILEKDCEILYYILKYSPDILISDSLYVEIIKYLGSQSIFILDKNSRFISLISNRKKELRKKTYINDDRYSEGYIEYSYDKVKLKTLIALTFYEAIVLKEQNRIEEFKHARTSFFKQCAYLVDDSKFKKELLKISILLSNRDILNSDNEVFNWQNDILNIPKLEQTIQSYKNIETDPQTRLSINNLKLERKSISCLIVGKCDGGLFVSYNSVLGIVLAKDIKYPAKYNLGDYIALFVLYYEKFSEEFVATTIQESLNYYLDEKNNLEWSKYWDIEGLKAYLHGSLIEQFKNVKIGDILTGVVKSITDFGAFIDLGFADALLHKDEIKWGYLQSIKSQIKLYQKYRVKVIAKNDQKLQINVSLKRLYENSWEKAENIKSGDVLLGKILNKHQKGIIIEIDNGLTGFLHSNYINTSQNSKAIKELRKRDPILITVKTINKEEEHLYFEKPSLYKKVDDKEKGNVAKEIETNSNADQNMRDISFEKSYIIENYAYITDNIANKIVLLEWVKIYTILYLTKKKYLIELYICFYNTIKLFNNKEEIDKIKEHFNKIFTENDFSKTTDIYPHTQKILQLVEILSLFGEIDDNNIAALFERIMGKNENNLVATNLAKLILSNNLMYSITKENRYLRLTQGQISKYLQKGILESFFNYDESDQQLAEEQLITKLIEGGESDTVEFKSSLLFDFKLGKANSLLEREILKTIVAFLNTKGGTLLIGVEDNGDICGLANDLKHIPGSSKNEHDRYLLYIDNLINNYIGKEFNIFCKVTFIDIYKKEICKIVVNHSNNPAFLSYKKTEQEFYIRNKAQSSKLLMSEAIKYLNQKNNSQLIL